MSGGFINWPESSEIIEAEVYPEKHAAYYRGKKLSLKNMRLGAPITGTIYGVLFNYKETLVDCEKMFSESPYVKKPEAPVLYIKPFNTYLGSNGEIPVPAEAEELEMNGTLGIVISRTAVHLSQEEVMEHIAGYTVVNDVTVPHTDVFRPAVPKKARDGFCPAGPWIIKKEAVKNPDSLSVKVYINQTLKQEVNTADLVRPIKKLISDITEFMTLYEGDVILAGIPGNAPRARAGDHVRIEIEQVGTLENTLTYEDESGAGEDR